MGLSGDAITSGITRLQPIKDNSLEAGKVWALVKGWKKLGLQSSQLNFSIESRRLTAFLYIFLLRIAMSSGKIQESPTSFFLIPLRICWVFFFPLSNVLLDQSKKTTMLL